MMMGRVGDEKVLPCLATLPIHKTLDSHITKFDHALFPTADSNPP